MPIELKELVDALPSIPGAASVNMGEDGFMKIVIDLNVPDDKFVETRVGAYGTLEWARELVQRVIMIKEMRYTEMMAKKAAASDIIKPGVVDVRGMRLP